MYKAPLFLMAFVLSIGAAHAGPGTKQTVTGTATAHLVQVLSVRHQNGAMLSFGTISASSSGTVVVSTSGRGSTTGGVSFAIGSTTSADRFRVSGRRFRRFSVVTGPGVVSNGSASMNFTTTPSVTSGRLPARGFLRIEIGGTLTVQAGQPAGSYTGSYPVVAYYD